MILTTKSVDYTEIHNCARAHNAHTFKNTMSVGETRLIMGLNTDKVAFVD